ncbi:UNKNOWN [Stylonychia lemnae]|uniref:Uncharacterized protein n=1 Tax=Stylonychia lemnae TaxID=5949 RepID=A0A078A7H5_STYLE|nr:UNKNOWN [Stylonychia lemnae]|eukprot:CDW77821.1 UNKNOWN [Stylonychia lemnae]
MGMGFIGVTLQSQSCYYKFDLKEFSQYQWVQIGIASNGLGIIPEPDSVNQTDPVNLMYKFHSNIIANFTCQTQYEAEPFSLQLIDVIVGQSLQPIYIENVKLKGLVCLDLTDELMFSSNQNYIPHFIGLDFNGRQIFIANPKVYDLGTYQLNISHEINNGQIFQQSITIKVKQQSQCAITNVTIFGASSTLNYFAGDELIIFDVNFKFNSTILCQYQSTFESPDISKNMLLSYITKMDDNGTQYRLASDSSIILSFDLIIRC